VKNIEEIKQQLLQFWQCTNTASEKCNFRVFPFCQVKERKGKEEYLYSAFLHQGTQKRSGMNHTVLPANNTMPALS